MVRAPARVFGALEAPAVDGSVTLVFAARDVKHSGAAALRRYLLERPE